MKKKWLWLLSWVMMCACSPVWAENITVSVAASLKEAFTEMAQLYQKQYPQDKIKLNAAASGILLQQLIQGAPVDILATADVETMNRAIQRQLIQTPTRKNFARNHLVLITPKNSLGIQKLSDLQHASVQKIALGQPASVPAGKYAQTALQQAQLFNTLKNKYIYTQNVRQVLDYVARGEVESGFVYRTDARLRASAVNVVANVPTPTPVVYQIALTQRNQTVAAKRFRDFVLSANGQAVLQKYGFEKSE